MFRKHTYPKLQRRWGSFHHVQRVFVFGSSMLPLVCKCVLLLSLLSPTSCAVNYTTVFIHGEGGWPCIRIPSIAQCGKMLHAFAECRTRTGDGCNPTSPHKSAGKQLLEYRVICELYIHLCLFFQWMLAFAIRTPVMMVQRGARYGR